MRTWSPEGPNGWYPHLSPDGRWIAYGNWQTFLADLVTGDGREITPPSGRMMPMGWFDDDTLIAVGDDPAQVYRISARHPEPISLGISTEHAVANWSAAGHGHWAVHSTSRPHATRDGTLFLTPHRQYGLALDGEHIVTADPDAGHVLRHYRGTTLLRTLPADNRWIVNAQGDVLTGYFGPVKLYRHDNGVWMEDATIAPWGKEGAAGALVRVGGDLWIWTPTCGVLGTDECWIIGRRFGERDPIVLPIPAVSVSAVLIGAEWIVAGADDKGQLKVVWCPLDQPRTNLSAPPPDVTVGRALWMGFYEFVPANTPGNCDLVVERDQPFLYLRDHDGRELATYVAGNPDGDPDAIERAVAETKAARPDLPCIAYVPFSKTQGRYVRAPENADVIGVEGYWKVGETDFEARWRRECEAHPRVALIPQCYTSNTDNILDLRAIVPVAARLARAVLSVAYVLPFSGSGRPTGYQDHPEVHDLWARFAASIQTPEDIAMPQLKAPEITVTAWTLDELRDGREFEFFDRENPDLNYRVRVGVRGGSMFAEMSNAAGTGATGARRPVKLAPEPAPPPPPPPPPPPTWEQMVRTTIRAVYAEDNRRPPRQADEDFILEQCYAPPRGAGWQASDIQAYVRALPRETAPGSRIAGRIRVEGRHFVNNAGVFRPRFASALTALAKSQDQVEAYLDWAQRQGFNGIRVFAGHLAWAGQTADSARARLPWLLAETHRRGLYIEVTALTDTREGKYDKPQHVQQITALCRDHEHTLSEIANEPFHATQDHEVQDPEYLVRLFKEIVQPSGVTCAIGAPSFDEPNRDGKFPFPVADYSTLHLDRGRDPWNMVRRVRELEAVSSVTGTPVLNNEPIGADEHPRPGSRVNDPALFYTMGLEERIFEVGGVHHSTAGLQCELPGIVQQACADAYLAGATAIPTDALLEFKNARRPDADGADSFMIWGNFPDDSHTGTVLRAFTGIDGDRAWTAVVGITGDPELEFRHGWRLVQVLDERPGVQLLELAR